VSDPIDLVLEKAHGNTSWMPADVHIVDRPEISFVYADRPQPLYNSVFRLRAKPKAHERLIAEVRGLHAGGPSEWRLTTPSLNGNIEPLLSEAGYALTTECRACSIPTDTERPAPPTDIEVRRVDTIDGLRRSFDVSSRAFGRENNNAYSDPDLQRFLNQCTGPNARTFRFLACDSSTGKALCSAAFNRHADLRFGFLWGGGTVPEARGRGIYSAILTARITEAKRLGLTHVGLHAVTTTSAPILIRQGFNTHGTMHVWAQDLRDT
jgi:GNAT superfamily N-acetyltransferase